MSSINGIGSTLYGECEYLPSGSYIATRWFIFAYVPILPMGSVRIHGISRERFSLTTQYTIEKVPLNMPQVLRTYAYTIACIGGVFALAAVADLLKPRFASAPAMLMIGMVLYIGAMSMLPSYLRYRAKLAAGFDDAVMFSKSTKQLAIVAAAVLVGFAIFMLFIQR